MAVSDKLTAVATMLFILSMISERVVTFIKLWCTEGRTFLFFVVPKEVDTSAKMNDAAAEAKRSRSILAINLTVGFFIALCAKASLFDMFSFTPDEAGVWNHLFSWEDENIFAEGGFERLVSILFGCALTGSFISLGSKFWHDLLDLLLEAKNLKAKLVDKHTYEFENTKQLDEYINADHNELARIAIEQNKQKIAVLPGVENYFVGISSDPSFRRPVIILHSSLSSGGTYPPSFKAKLPSGKDFEVKAEVVYGFTIPRAYINSGDSVCNIATAQTSGTICCTVSRGDKKYLLTCAHVMTGGLSSVSAAVDKGWFSSPLPDDASSADIGYGSLGSWAYGVIDSGFDVALIDSEQYTDPVPNATYPPPFREDMKHEEVFVNGNLNQKYGYIIGFTSHEIPFQYNGGTFRHARLIQIAANRSNDPVSLTDPGDSGALVYRTKDKVAIGMVIGGNGQFTYLIPMNTILDNTQTKLV
ncbi:hypothetical protein [Flavobacterium sp.]|uniref:hypothetical protein n=1 Tax=Flavobacterium sp. TaxID=239 RepID=UPI0040335C65